MRDKTVVDAMTPLESVYMLDFNGVIDRNAMQEVCINASLGIRFHTTHAPPFQLLHRGHSRVPVCDGSNDKIVGMLLVKKLIQLDPDDCTPITSLPGAHIPPPSCLTNKPLYDLLNLFQTGRSEDADSRATLGWCSFIHCACVCSIGHLYMVYEEESEQSEVSCYEGKVPVVLVM